MLSFRKINIRRAEVTDVIALQKLQNHVENEYNIDVKLLYECCDYSTLIDTLPYTLVGTEPDTNNTEKIVGFIAVNNKPSHQVLASILETDSSYKDSKISIEFVERGNWPIILQEQYACENLKLLNSHFLVHMMVYSSEFEIPFIHTALKSIFMNVPQIERLLFFTPTQQPLFSPLRNPIFVENPNLEEDSDDEDGKKITSPPYFEYVKQLNQNAMFEMHICQRQNILPLFIVRKARVEDCDDLAPMFRRSNMLTKELDDYEIGQILEMSDKGTQNLVAEVNHTVVGFMSLDCNIDYLTLLEEYQIDAYDSLFEEGENKKVTSKSPQKPTTPSTFDSKRTELSCNLSDINQESTITIRDDPADKDKVSSAASGTTTDQFPCQSKRNSPNSNDEVAFYPIKLDDSFEVAEKKRLASRMKRLANAFCVKMFCINEEYSGFSHQFIKPAFALFPDKDYCFFSQENDHKYLNLLKSFNQVPERPGKAPPETLYMVNRYGVSSNLEAILATQNHIPEIHELLNDLSYGNKLSLRTEQLILADPANNNGNTKGGIVILAQCHKQVVGVCILEKQDFEQLSEQFDVEEYLSLESHEPLHRDKYISIEHLILNPLFFHQVRKFIEQVLLLLGIDCLFYLPSEERDFDICTRTAVIPESIMLKRRRRIQYPNDINDGVPVSPQLRSPLHMFTLPRLYEPKIIINTRIVFIGASDACLSFVEKCLYSSHLLFTHICIISCAGLPVIEEQDMFLNARCFTRLSMEQMSFENYVQVIKDTVTTLNRNKKQIFLRSGAAISYDVLIFSSGLEFTPSLVNSQFSIFSSVIAVNRNNRERINEAIAQEAATGTGNILVYGRHLQAFAVIEGLLKRKISGQQITFIIPPYRNNITCFDNPKLEEKIFAELDAAGVKVHRNFEYESHGVKDGYKLGAITFKGAKWNPTQKLVLSCCLFLYADKVAVNEEAFHAINNSYLVFDGRLVIDGNFRTEDRNIFAIGSLTKYSSRYQTKWLPSYFNSREIGYHVADVILPFYDPTYPRNRHSDSMDIAVYHDPKCVEAYLPGGFYYLHYDKPRIPGTSLEARRNSEGYGRDLVLENKEWDKYCYFRIQLDEDGYVCSLTYYGDPRVPSNNYMALNGLHEKYLNRLVSRYDEGVIESFVKFLNETWALPLFYDRFSIFRNQSRLEMLEALSADTEKILSSLLPYVDNPKEKVPEKLRKQLYKDFDESEDRKVFSNKVYSYLRALKVRL